MSPKLLLRVWNALAARHQDAQALVAHAANAHVRDRETDTVDVQLRSYSRLEQRVRECRRLAERVTRVRVAWANASSRDRVVIPPPISAIDYGYDCRWVIEGKPQDANIHSRIAASVAEELAWRSSIEKKRQSRVVQHKTRQGWGVSMLALTKASQILIEKQLMEDVGKYLHVAEMAQYDALVQRLSCQADLDEETAARLDVLPRLRACVREPNHGGWHQFADIRWDGPVRGR